MKTWMTQLKQTARRAALTLLLGAGLIVQPALAQSDGVSQLQNFMAQVQHGGGGFEQVVHAASGRLPEHARGEFVFSRPGKFRWRYTTPYPQLLVSDGERLWAWDEDLNQVTIQSLGEALGNTPAAVIAGTGNLNDSFVLENAGEHDGLAWVEATPRQTESMFSRIRLGLSDGLLRKMEMLDNFGQRTEIEFLRFRTDLIVPDELFRFEVPPGADVLGG
jgi:outer membrane lipoprotein carrier protein